VVDAQIIQFIGFIIFIATYILISSEKLHRPISALLGASILSILLIVSEWPYEGHSVEFHTIVTKVEWNTIIFITAMMIITIISSHSGLFQYLSIIIVRFTKGNPQTLLISLSLLTLVLC